DPQEKFNNDVFETYQRAIALRRQLPALRLGFFHTILCDDAHGIYSFARELGDEHVYVVLNRSPREQTAKLPVQGERFIDWLDQSHPKILARSGEATVALKAWGVAVLAQ